MDVEPPDRVVGDEEGEGIDEISTGESLTSTTGTVTTVGAVTSARNGEVEVSFKRPVRTEKDVKIAINRHVGAHWRLIGTGTLE